VHGITPVQNHICQRSFIIALRGNHIQMAKDMRQRIYLAEFMLLTYRVMSALGQADISRNESDIRFTPESRHQSHHAECLRKGFAAQQPLSAMSPTNRHWERWLKQNPGRARLCEN
jgi:hypothetical protein